MPTRRGREPPIQELWNIAYEKLRNEDEELVQDFENSMTGDLNAALGMTVGSQIDRKDWMGTVLKCKMEQVNRESWKLKFGSAELPLQEVVKPILGVVGWANDFISKAVSANPTASIAWGGLFLNPSEQAASLAKGLEYISSLIVQSYLWENLYERHYKSGAGKSSEISSTIYRNALEMLYQHVLRFQITSYRYYSRHYAYRLGLDSVKWNEWDSLFEKVKEQERVFADVLKACRDDKYLEECLAAEQRHKQVMDCWQSIGTDVSGLLKAVHDARKEDKRKNLLDWLWAANISVQYTAARSKHSEGTCEWLVRRSKDFRMWEKEPKSFLWLNGKAGSGKSILSSSVIKHLKDEYEDDPQTALAYHFFSFGNLDQQKVTAMLSSLVRQLCASRPDTPRPIKRFENYMARGERPDVTTLENALIAAVHGFSAVFIVVDALDECPTLQGERPKLLACLRRIIATMPDNLHIFCTSRAERDIYATIDKVLSLPAKVAIDLTQNRVGLNDDLRQYTESVLATETYDSWPEELKIDAKELLLEQADGMFQYLVCQFEVLQQCVHSEEEIRSALNNLPKGLDETYERLLLGVGHGVQPQVLGSLKWLALANRDLTLDELAEIFVFHPNCAAEFTNYQRLFKPEDVLQYFQSLEDLDSALLEAAREGNADVVEFLLNEGADANAQIEPPILDPSGEAQFINNLTYDLQMDSYTVGGALHAAAFNGDLKILQLLLDSGADVNTRYNTIGSVFEAAASQDSSAVLKFLLSRRVDAACLVKPRASRKMKEIKAAVMRLLDMGADVNAQGGKYGNALQAACHAENSDMIRLLLDRGAEINRQGGFFGTAFQAACATNASAIVNVLLDNGADVDIQGGEYGNALQAACYGNGDKPDDVQRQTQRLEIVRKLLEKGVDVNATGGKFQTALQGAAASKYDDGNLEEFLLSKGADVNEQGGEYGTALQSACVTNSIRKVRVLLDHGAAVNIEGGKYGTALQAACARNNSRYRSSEPETDNDSIPGLLIGHGADVHAQGGAFGSAWHAAASRNGPNNETLKLLLDNGIDVNDNRGLQCGTALQAAFQLDASPSAIVSRVNFLLEHGADVNQGAGSHGFPLQSACMSPGGDDGLVRLLETCTDIDVNMTGGLLGTALQAAVHEGKTHAVRLLLNKGADCNIRGGKCGSALNAAIVRGYWDLVDILMDAGAEPDCHQLLKPDEEWIKRVREEYGSGAVERYKTFWEEKMKLKERKA
ncbi:putative ankyrin repeat protein [Colletotrichum sp. SAR 10_76]|nr:putative ankyrin repeat protein [Colletotrichum sp. SAR 10_76]